MDTASKTDTHPQRCLVTVAVVMHGRLVRNLPPVIELVKAVLSGVKTQKLFVCVSADTHSDLARAVRARLKNQPRKGRSCPWKPKGRWSCGWAVGRGALSGSSKLDLSSSARSEGTNGGTARKERE